MNASRLEPGEALRMREAARDELVAARPFPIWAEAVVKARVGDADPLARDAQRPFYIVGGVLGVDEDDVTALRLACGGAVHRDRPAVEPFREVERPQVVDHGRARAR